MVMQAVKVIDEGQKINSKFATDQRFNLNTQKGDRISIMNRLDQGSFMKLEIQGALESMIVQNEDSKLSCSRNYTKICKTIVSMSVFVVVITTLIMVSTETLYEDESKNHTVRKGCFNCSSELIDFDVPPPKKVDVRYETTSPDVAFQSVARYLGSSSGVSSEISTEEDFSEQNSALNLHEALQSNLLNAESFNGLKNQSANNSDTNSTLSFENASTEESTLNSTDGHVNITFYPGRLNVEENGLLLAQGLESRIIAQSGQKVHFANGKKSSKPFHLRPDGAAIFADTETGGYIYVSNSEKGRGRGGVGAIKFDNQGEVVDYYPILEGTSRNCQGGKMPWGSWVRYVKSLIEMES